MIEDAIYSFLHQYGGPFRKEMPCEVCGVPVIHCATWPFGPEGEVRWRVSQDHLAPCDRVCLLSAEGSHFGGQVMRSFALTEDCHRGRFCACQQEEEPVERPKNRIRIPVHPSKRRPGG